MSPANASSAGRTFLGIQYLRALAAGLVVVWHATYYLAPAIDRSQDLVSLGQAGVDIFFVISGFIIFYTTAVSPMGWQEFMARRIVRIVPTYWLYTTAAIALFVVAPGAFRHFALAPWHAISSYLFIPSFHPSHPGGIAPVFPPGWTLNYEMFFYAIFALLLTLSLANRLRAVLAIMVSLVLLGALFPPEAAPLNVYTDPIIFEFAAGCLVAWVVCRGVRIPKALCLTMVALAALGFALSLSMEDWPRAVRWGAPSLLLVAGVSLYEASYGMRRIGLLKRLGDASYSLYLTQTFTIPAGVFIWGFAGLSGYPSVAFIVPATIVSHCVGWLAYVVIERRATAFFGAILVTGDALRARRWPHRRAGI